jgi:hypothetical protein
MTFFRRARTFDNLLQDPKFPFQVGRLAGATEMTSHWLLLQEDVQAKELGRRLGEVVDWFCADDSDKVDDWGSVKEEGPTKHV